MADTHPSASAARLVRSSVLVDGDPASLLTIPADGPTVLLLHGTYWSRVWQPVLPFIAAAGFRPVAVDLRGLGFSDGELDIRTGAVPALAAWVERFVAAINVSTPLHVVGHDIGGAIAQHLVVRGELDVQRLALANSVTFDSWPVPGVARYRDPAVLAAVTEEEMLTSRRSAIETALAGAASPKLVDEYLEPWRSENVRRSWLHLAAAADNRYTMEIVGELQASPVPKLLIWGENDQFQRIENAERFVAEIPGSTLVRINDAGHIPMENDALRVAQALIDFFRD